MNALGIAHAVQELGATLVVENGQVVIRSHTPLPEELQQEVRAHKAELLIALGEPMDQTVAPFWATCAPISQNPSSGCPTIACSRSLTGASWRPGVGRSTRYTGDLSVSTQA